MGYQYDRDRASILASYEAGLPGRVWPRMPDGP
jgi:hypothetical protein